VDSSVIVCTYNRAESLRDTLRALKAQQPAAGRKWEVVVVDNNSSDGTPRVVEEFQREWPTLRYQFEGEQGLSHARNRGIAAARGNILLFTDDDVLPEPDWMEVTLAGLEKYRADACGGYIAPIWEVPPPDWLTDRFYGFLAVRTERSDDYDIVSPSQAPYGANMAFRRNVFQTVGGFNTNRGRKGNVLASGEDGELFERILRAGLKAVFLGQSRVHHKVESFRLTKRYLRRWRYQTSRNLAQTRGLPGTRRLFNIPPYLYSQLGRAVWNALWGRLAEPADEAFNREMIVWHFLGSLAGLWRMRAEAAMTNNNLST